jgi:antitoxin component YwqK of YwqJK toxin-antitoxin module
MKCSFVLLFTLIFFLSSAGQQSLNQTDAQGLKQGFWLKKYPDGTKMYEGYFKDNKPAGQWKRYHPNGALKAILQYSETSDSVKAQLFETFTTPVATGFYLNEKKCGIWTYFANGIKVAEESFSDGLKNGQCRKYYPSGELLELTDWKNNLREGKYQAFFQSGKPFLECMYKNDQRSGRCFSYYPSGITEVESFYQNDLPEGTWKYFDTNGNIRYSLTYIKGKLQNPDVLLKLNSQQLDSLEKQREKLADPEKYLQNPEEYLQRKK